MRVAVQAALHGVRTATCIGGVCTEVQTRCAQVIAQPTFCSVNVPFVDFNSSNSSKVYTDEKTDEKVDEKVN